jgi:hypothetical protein
VSLLADRSLLASYAKQIRPVSREIVEAKGRKLIESRPVESARSAET